MFNFLKKRKPAGTELKIKISGMHCTNCAMNIDDALEETPGIISANTSYAKSEVSIVFDPEKVTQEKITEVIKSTGYTPQL